MQAQSQQRSIVYAADPHDLSVTIYRDPDRDEYGELEEDDPGGFAMISETRMVTLPAGESTIRFDGVAEGMVGVSAIVTGLPGGTIEKNRNAELLSPAALVNGTLGNRVMITRTNPATGETVSENAIVRTRADGGLVLQNGDGFEAVRCAGVPETLGFDRVPDGLSAKPVFSIDTRDESGGTYQVTLTYLSWGFDWQANYVATLSEEGGSVEFDMGVLSWLTVLNDNGQSFDNAQLLVVAGTLNVVSDYEDLADPPTGEALSLTCYPIGSTAAGSPIVYPAEPWGSGQNALPTPQAFDSNIITVRAQRRGNSVQDVSAAVEALSSEVLEAREEQLGDLKLYRVPERVTVSAQGIKQVAFLNRNNVEAGFFYELNCSAGLIRRRNSSTNPSPTDIYLHTENDEEHGLGVALPQGPFILFEHGRLGPMLVGQNALRDYAMGQEVELQVGQSQHVFGRCAPRSEKNFDERYDNWNRIEADLTNSNDHDVLVRVDLGRSGDWDIRWSYGETEIKDGRIIAELILPARADWQLQWDVRHPS